MPRAAWCATIRSDQPMFFAGLVIVYTTLVSIAFEYGENDRFKFVVEQPIWVFIVAVSSRGWALWKARSPAPLPLRTRARVDR